VLKLTGIIKMQNIDNIVIKPLDNQTVADIKDAYENFLERCRDDYKFEMSPLDYEGFVNIVGMGIIKGFVLHEDSIVKGFLLYVLEEHKAIEINIIHFIDRPDKQTDAKRRKALLSSLLEELKPRDDWKVISYAMLGLQESYVRDIVLLGFSLIGQAIVKFRFDDILNYELLLKSASMNLAEGYSVTEWKDEYFESASRVIHETFQNASDSKFDPRFLSLEGSKDVVNKIVTGVFGYFIPEATSVLFVNGNIEGVAFVAVPTMTLANIPLIGITKPHRKKELGKYMLKSCLNGIIEQIKNKKIFVNEVNAAVETDNFPALKMYRRIGFREEMTYPHAYLKNPNYRDAD